MPANPGAYVPTTRLLPPSLPDPHVARPRIATLLDEASRHPLTLVVAGVGYGKSTALAAWAADRRLSWYACTTQDTRLVNLLQGLAAALRTRVVRLPPELDSAVRGIAGPDSDDAERADALATLLAEAIDAAGGDPLHLVVDDLGLLPEDSGGSRLVQALVRQAPARLRLVLASDGRLPALLSRGRGTRELSGRDLAFTTEEITQLLQATGPVGPELAEQVREATAGWPAAVRLVAEALRDRSSGDASDILARVHRRTGRSFDLLVDEVLRRMPVAHREVLARLVPLPQITDRMCRDLGLSEDPEVLNELERRGLLVELDDADGARSLAPMVRETLRHAAPLDPDEQQRLAVRAAGWYEREGRLEDSLQLLAEFGTGDEIARLLREQGARLVATGACATVVRAIEWLPEAHRTTDIRLVESHARQVLGDWEGALAAFEQLGGSEDPLPAATAWRMGLIHHLRGDLRGALATYERGMADPTAVPRAHLLAWSATARWLLGDTETCRTQAEEAFALAQDAGDPAALAICHTTLALIAAGDGDRRANDHHYLRALAAAEEAGDVLQLLRIRCNRGSRSLEEGAYHDALTELELALRLGEASGYAALHALSLCNRGETRLKLGRLEEAIADHEIARALYQRIDSSMVAYALLGLGDVHRTRGDLTLARAAYEEAVTIARDSGDAQGLSPSLAGLARVVAATDLPLARALAEEAVDRNIGLTAVGAHLAAGFVALASDDHATAVTHAEQAQRAARQRRDRAGLAESLELAAVLAEDAHHAVTLLDEAVSIWRDLGDPIGQARAELASARLDPDGVRHTAAALAVRRLNAVGVRLRATEAAGTLAAVAEHRARNVEIRTLGGFTVWRDGAAVPHGAWQSRKARDLIKILIARHGRPTSREQLAALLWPDEPHEQVSSRLSGLLSVARSVLDPDKRHDANAFLVADRHTIGLDLRRVSVDVETFLATATEGLALRTSDPERAAELLEEAETAYTGDALEEDPYEEWAIPLREEARATYVSVARSLAHGALGARDADRAVRYLLRVLEQDAFDERAHHELIRALATDGRHGEARRRYRVYTTRMAELGVAATPLADLVEPR